jgi:undecaprenyl pyrophosphate phosphatase UppP
VGIATTGFCHPGEIRRTHHQHHRQDQSQEKEEIVEFVINYFVQRPTGFFRAHEAQSDLPSSSSTSFNFVFGGVNSVNIKQQLHRESRKFQRFDNIDTLQVSTIGQTQGLTVANSPSDTRTRCYTFNYVKFISPNNFQLVLLFACSFLRHNITADQE